MQCQRTAFLLNVHDIKETFHLFAIRAMYFPIISNSMFTIVPTVIVWKLVCSYV